MRVTLVYGPLVALALVGVAVAGCKPPPNAWNEAAHEDFCKASSLTPDLRELAAASEYIVIAKPDVPKQRLLAAEKLEVPHYINIPLREMQPVKGSLPEAAILKVYPRDAKPTNARLIAASGETTILFLSAVGRNSSELYLTHHEAALQPATRTLIDLWQHEVSVQTALLEKWQPDPSLPHYRKVERLISKLTRPSGSIDTHERIFRQMVDLGDAAVPAIIHQMDNRQTLPVEGISLVHSNPQARESITHHGAILIVDALDEILTQLTNKSFGEIQAVDDIRNPEANIERRSAVSGWRIYSALRGCAWNTAKRQRPPGLTNPS